MGYRISEAELLMIQARLASKRKDSQGALESRLQAERLAEQGGYGRALAETESELAKLGKKHGDFQGAEAHLTRGIDTMKNIGDSCNLPQRLKELANLKLSRSNLAEASAVYDEIADITEGMIASSNSEYAKASLVGALSDVFLSHFTLLADRLKDPKRAFAVLERARGRGVSDQLQSDTPPNEEEILDHKKPIYRELSALNRNLMRSSNSAVRASLLYQITATKQKFGPVIAEHNVYRKAVASKPVPLEQIQQTLRSDELLLEYVVTEPVSFCIAIRRGGIDLVRLAT